MSYASNLRFQESKVAGLLFCPCSIHQVTNLSDVLLVHVLGSLEKDYVLCLET